MNSFFRFTNAEKDKYKFITIHGPMREFTNAHALTFHSVLFRQLCLRQIRCGFQKLYLKNGLHNGKLVKRMLYLFVKLNTSTLTAWERGFV